MTNMPEKKNVPAVNDGFASSDPTDNPLRGTGLRFKDGSYFSYGDKMDVKGKAYAVIGRVQGWQKLERDCPPEYLIRQTGGPKPAQPFVDKKDWPMDLNGKPVHPWKWTHYLYLLDTTTGEFSTFWSNTVGGEIAVRALDDQVMLMRNVNPNAMPVVALESADMPTSFGSTKPRPHFQLLGWKARDADPQNLLTAAPKLVDVEKPSLKETLNDELPDFGAERAPEVSSIYRGYMINGSGNHYTVEKDRLIVHLAASEAVARSWIDHTIKEEQRRASTAKSKS